MTSTSDTPASRLKRLTAVELRPKKLTLHLPPGLAVQLESAAQKAGLSPEQWLVAAAFEKLRRELFRPNRKKPRRRSRTGVTTAKSTPDFFLNMLRSRQAGRRK